MKPVRLSFVCLGNICRSPTAEAVMRHLIKEEGLQEKILLDSAGLGDWHLGEARDARSQAVGHRRGIPLEGVARQFSGPDFDRFDYVLAMDRQNRDGLLRIAPDAEVPDPYYGGPQGFDEVFDICLAACEGLLAELRREHKLDG